MNVSKPVVHFDNWHNYCDSPFTMSSSDGMNHRGALIVVEGLDRAGKTSQCQLLLEALRQRGHQVKYIKFPGTLWLLSAPNLLSKLYAC